MRDENDEPIYTFNDKYLRHFVRQSIKGGCVRALNENFKSKLCCDIFKILSRELYVEGNVYVNIEASMKYKNDHLKINKEEYKNKFNQRIAKEI